MNDNFGKQIYSKAFYNAQSQRSYQSAKKLLKYFFQYYKPESMVDFGCGIGTWLLAAGELGVKQLSGIDGNWITNQAIATDTHKPIYHYHNLEESIKLNQKFDLAISLEVAEHLSENRASSFVADICQASNLVIFGAAIKGQGGVNHINEQRQSYWIKLFEKQDFVCIDCFRRHFWYDDEVGQGYRQNTFLYIKNGDERITLFEQWINNEIYMPYDICHPKVLETRVRLNESPKYCGLKTYLRTTPMIPWFIVQALLKRLSKIRD